VHRYVRCRCSDREAGLAGHAWFETFSVLTRLPPPQRRRADEVITMLTTNFPASVFPDAVVQREFVEELPRLQIAGGAIYDALVVLAARSVNMPLLSCDRRAGATYAQFAVEVEFVAQP
jgi:toxin FitB